MGRDNAMSDENRAVLQHFLCQEFGYPDAPAMLSQLDRVKPDIRSYRDSDYAAALYHGAEAGLVVTPEQMVKYDRHIAVHSESLGWPENGDCFWTPCLYLALLFTERYLDRYFSDAWKLRDDLNRSRSENPDTRPLPEYTKDDLRALAVHSGADDAESRLVPLHILQYRDWTGKAGKQLHNVLLLAPDQDAVARWERSLAASQIRARAFRPEAESPLRPTVEIIELRQFGPASDFDRPLMAAEFSPQTLVLVDKGHLDAPSQSIWRELRPEFLFQGFVCEYCSSFHQAVHQTPELNDCYAKCLLLDFPRR